MDAVESMGQGGRGADGSGTVHASDRPERPEYARFAANGPLDGAGEL